jgi:hypothetical protein
VYGVPAEPNPDRLGRVAHLSGADPTLVRRRKPAVHGVEPQEQGEPEFRQPRRPDNSASIPDQRPVPDQLVFVQRTRIRLSHKRAASSHRKPHETRMAHRWERRPR